MRILVLIIVLITLSACSNSEEGNSILDILNDDTSETEDSLSSNNLFDQSTVQKERWMSYDGQVKTTNETMVLSDYIEFDSKSTYMINKSIYVSYFDKEEFIKTLKYENITEETSLEPVKEANKIKVSLFEKDIEEFVIYEK